MESEEEKGKRGAWPDSLINPPGLVGDVVKWIRESSGMDQPKFALAAGLAVCGALIGRAVKDWTGQRSNLYVLAVGLTAAGKNTPLSAIRRLVSALGQSKLVVGEATSASAIEMLLDVFPVRMLLLDEVGYYISSMRRGAADSHLRSVVPALLKCWSCAGDVYCGKVRAKSADGKYEPPRIIPEPCLCVYGTTTPGVLFDSLTSGDFADGFVSRFLSFVSLDRPKFEPRPDCVIPDGLLRKIKKTLRALGVPCHGARTADGLKAADVPAAREAARTEEAEAVFSRLGEDAFKFLTYADQGEKELLVWGRAVELARRVALIVAAFRCPERVVVEKMDAEYGVALVSKCLFELVEYAEANVADTRAERNKKRVLRLIRAWGERGITKSDITRQTQSMGKKEREEALEDLLEAEAVEFRVIQGARGKPMTLYTVKE